MEHPGPVLGGSTIQGGSWPVSIQKSPFADLWETNASAWGVLRSPRVVPVGRRLLCQRPLLQMPLPGRPHKPDAQDTMDLSPCQLAAWGAPWGTTFQRTTSQHPHVSSGKGQSSWWCRRHISLLGRAGWSRRRWEGRGSRRTKNDGERFSVVSGR